MEDHKRSVKNLLNGISPVALEKSNAIRVLFIQPAYAKYRQSLFEKLHRYFNIGFCFLEGSPANFQGEYLKTYACTSPNSKGKITSGLVYSTRKYLRLTLFLIRANYSIVVSTGPLYPATLISLLISKIRRRKFVLWVEDWFIPRPVSLITRFRFSVAFLFVKFVMKSVDAIVVEGRPQYMYVRSHDIPHEKTFHANHCSTDYSKYPSTDLKRKFNLENALVVLYLGRIIERKGLDFLIRAFSKIEQERSDVFLLVCGEGDFGTYCKYLARELKIKRIIFLGRVSDGEIASYYKTADVFVLPSCARGHQGAILRALSVRAYVEGWGLVVNEAMSMGKPIITTDAVGAAQDLVRNGVNGYVVKNEDAHELYVALREILEDAELRQAMGKNSRRVFEEFNDYDKEFRGFKKAIEYAAK